jgi:hypothetical protein
MTKDESQGSAELAMKPEPPSGVQYLTTPMPRLILLLEEDFGVNRRSPVLLFWLSVPGGCYAG